MKPHKSKRGGHREGSGRKPLAASEHTVKFACRLHPYAVKNIKILAQKWGLSESRIVAVSVELSKDSDFLYCFRKK